MSDYIPKIGDRIKDNDPRRPGRILTVMALYPHGVCAQNSGGGSVTILTRRIYCDGKPRRNGFDLIKDTP